MDPSQSPPHNNRYPKNQLKNPCQYTPRGLDRRTVSPANSTSRYRSSRVDVLINTFLGEKVERSVLVNTRPPSETGFVKFSLLGDSSVALKNDIYVVVNESGNLLTFVREQYMDPCLFPGYDIRRTTEATS